MIIPRVTGPQCSYRAEVQGATIVSHLARVDDDLAIDTEAVVRTAAHCPHKECAHMDLRQEAHTNFSRTPVHIRWMPSHQQAQHYHTLQQVQDIRATDALARLAKMAAMLPLPQPPPPALADIQVSARVIPTPVKKWVASRSLHSLPQCNACKTKKNAGPLGGPRHSS